MQVQYGAQINEDGSYTPLFRKATSQEAKSMFSETCPQASPKKKEIETKSEPRIRDAKFVETDEKLKVGKKYIFKNETILIRKSERKSVLYTCASDDLKVKIMNKEVFLERLSKGEII